MLQKKELWIDKVLEQGVERQIVEPNPYLLSKIKNKLESVDNTWSYRFQLKFVLPSLVFVLFANIGVLWYAQTFDQITANIETAQNIQSSINPEIQQLVSLEADFNEEYLFND